MTQCTGRGDYVNFPLLFHPGPPDASPGLCGGAWTPGPSCVTLPQVGLGDLGARVRLVDTDGDDLGLAHLPRPVEPGDLAALKQGFPLRLVAVVEFELGGAVDVLAEVEAAPNLPDQLAGAVWCA
jgi:hypothetical protein